MFPKHTKRTLFPPVLELELEDMSREEEKEAS